MSLYERHENLLERCVDTLKYWQQLIGENFEGDEKIAQIDKLKKITKDYCDVEIDFKRSVKALEKVENELSKDVDGTSTTDIEKLYKSNLESEPDSTDTYKNSEIWQTIIKGQKDVMEVKQKKTKLDESQFEELSESLMCSNVFTPPIDPISKMVIRNPCKNRKCKHVYENSTITTYIKQLKKKARCPYIGCKNNNLIISDLIEDGQLQSQISQYLETQETAEDTEDDD